MNMASDPIIQAVAHRDAADENETCGVVIAYEDTEARDRAITLSHRLVRDFWREIDFSFSWWRFKYLRDPVIASAASDAATKADIVVFSYHVANELPIEATDWLDRWTSARSRPAGIVVPLVESVPVPEIEASSALVCLQDAARRAGMECLTPGQMRYPFSPLGSVEYIHDRANQTTRVLDDIMKNMGTLPTPPTHWGINE
jgi:hypothetical protein